MLIDAKPLEGYLDPYGLLCAILEDGTNEWRSELPQNLNDKAMVWQAYPGGHSIGGTILHMISAEIYWFEQVVLDLPLDPQESAILHSEAANIDEWEWATPPEKPLSWYFDFQDRIRARMLESIKKWPPSDTTFEHHGRQITARWIFGHVIQHESYHGGQAVLLGRLWQIQSQE